MNIDDLKKVLGCTYETARRIRLGIVPPGEDKRRAIARHFGWD
jgi:hypothetical protein